MKKKRLSKWVDEKILVCLQTIIKNINNFPTQKDLYKIGRSDLVHAMQRNGGMNKFKVQCGYILHKRTNGFWSKNTIINELEMLTNELGYFPTHKELLKLDRHDLDSAILSHGGFHYFRTLLHYSPLRKDHYWTKEVTLKELSNIINNIGHFPSYYELCILNRHDLIGSINKYGGFVKFKELLGYTVSIQKKYLSGIQSYSNKRGKKSEIITKKIIKKYCELHNLPSPSYNVKLVKGNIIEFVCNTGKKIGIDVTNTKQKTSAGISKKWTKKIYHKYLDELWIVVFSNIFTQLDYHKWNQDSPDNVKVMSIQQFIDELDYSLDEYTKQKIDKYCACTFHTKSEFIKKHNNILMLPKTCSNIMVI